MAIKTTQKTAWMSINASSTQWDKKTHEVSPMNLQTECIAHWMYVVSCPLKKSQGYPFFSKLLISHYYDTFFNKGRTWIEVVPKNTFWCFKIKKSLESWLKLAPKRNWILLNKCVLQLQEYASLEWHRIFYTVNHLRY